MRSAFYQLIVNTEFEPCQKQPVAVCVDSSDGSDVIEAGSRVMPLLSSEDQTGVDLLVLLAIGIVYKLLYIAGVVYKSRQASHFQDNTAEIWAHEIQIYNVQSWTPWGC